MPISQNEDVPDILQRWTFNTCFNVELKELEAQKYRILYGSFPFAIPAQQSVSPDVFA